MKPYASVSFRAPRRSGACVGHLAAAFVLAAQAYAQSAVMIQPQLIFSNATTVLGTSLADLSNQSGLSVTYQPGVTDYDSYVASSPVGPGSPGIGSAQFQPNVNAIFDYDLGATVDLTNMLLLNQPAGVITRVVNFRLFISDTSDFLSSTSLGTYTSAPTAIPAAMETFDLPDTEGRYVRFEILSNGGSGSTRFGEIAFAGNPIPEPCTAVLGALGLFAAIRRRRS